MRPPICAICDEDIRIDLNQGGGISFALTEKDKTFNERLKEPGFVGHPAGYEWFCENHYAVALKYKHLTWPEACKAIKNELEAE